MTFQRRVHENRAPDQGAAFSNFNTIRVHPDLISSYQGTAKAPRARCRAPETPPRHDTKSPQVLPGLQPVSGRQVPKPPRTNTRPPTVTTTEFAARAAWWISPPCARQGDPDARPAHGVHRMRMVGRHARQLGREAPNIALTDPLACPNAFRPPQALRPPPAAAARTPSHPAPHAAGRSSGTYPSRRRAGGGRGGRVLHCLVAPQLLRFPYTVSPPHDHSQRLERLRPCDSGPATSAGTTRVVSRCSRRGARGMARCLRRGARGVPAVLYLPLFMSMRLPFWFCEVLSTC